MEKQKYYFIVHPHKKGLWLSSDDRIMFLFSSYDLAQTRRNKWGSGIVRGLDRAGLVEEFSPCCKVILDPDEKPTAADAIRICDLA